MKIFKKVMNQKWDEIILLTDKNQFNLGNQIS